MESRQAAARFLAAVNDRRVDAVEEYLHPDVTWRNVPEAPTEGRQAVSGMLARVLSRCERVRWEVISDSYAADTAWLERIDRFWIDGREIAVCCNGVFRFESGSGRLLEVRDYADLGPWRRTLADAIGAR